MNFVETERTELKQRFTDAIPKEIVAFLNTDGGAVYIGVNDDGSVCGVENLDDSEVWFNACLHNNWADGTPPAIYIYTDRLEIISTGGLPHNLSKEDFYRGVSKPVNEELAKIFIRLDLMEQTGFGIPLVTKRYGKNAFEFLDFFLRVTIPFAFEIENEEKQDSATIAQRLPRDCPEIAQKMYLAISSNPFATIDELSKMLGIS